MNFSKKRISIVNTSTVAISSIAPMFSIRSLEPTRPMSVSSSPMLFSPSVLRLLKSQALIWQASSSTSSLFKPKRLLKADLKNSVGMNSPRAKTLSYFKTTLVVAGSMINQVCIKMRNWSKFIIFHRYLRPIARNNCKTMMTIEKVDIEETMSSLRFSRA